MADKKKSASTVYPFFVDGEQPSANKFNSISLQTRTNLFDLEKSIGDIWGESEPYNSSSSVKLTSFNADKSSYSIRNGSPSEGYSLNIANLGRIIGPASKLNPYNLSEGLLGTGNTLGLQREITESIPDQVNSFSLRYPGVQGSSISFLGTNTPTNSVASANLLLAAGDYYYDESKGVIYFYGNSGTSQSWQVVYLTEPNQYSGGASYSGSSWNVMPDEAALEAGVRLIVSAGGDYYDFALPQISVQNVTNNSGSTGSSLDESDINYGVQLKLPNVLREMFNGGSSSIYFDNTAAGIQDSLIPEGFLYIKNLSTGEIYSNGEYYYIDNETVRMRGVELDNLTDMYCIITVGTDITSSIQDIRLKQAEHSHSREFGEPLVKVEDLGGIVEKAGVSGQFTKSQNESNFAPQYLHRDGYRSNVDAGLNDSNAMRGDLVIGRELDGSSSTVGAGDYLGDGHSFKLYFGEHNSESYIYQWWDNTENKSTLYLHGQKTEVFGTEHVYVRSNDDMYVRALNDIEVKAENEYKNTSVYNEQTHGAKLGTIREDISHTQNGDTQNLEWRSRHMQCITISAKEAYFEAVNASGGTSIGDKVYAYRRFLLPADLITNNYSLGENHKIWSISVMAKPHGANAEFSNFPGTGSSSGMNGPSGNGYGVFGNKDWSGSSAGGEANASVGWFNSLGGIAALLNFWSFVVGQVIGLGDLFDRVVGNGLWWKFGVLNSGAANAQPYIDVYVGEGWMSNNDLTQDNGGVNLNVRIAVWYSQDDGYGEV